MARLQGKKALVLGLGVSGKAAAEFLLAQGAFATAVDQNCDAMRGQEHVQRLMECGLKLFSDKEPLALSSFDCLIVSPGISPDHPIYRAALETGVEVIGEVELACRNLYPNQKVIGITGTNGKTTVTLLVAHVLNHSGIQAHALGNVGVPLTEQIAQHRESSVFVVELSSYQIDTLHSKVVDAGAILNITPDHLDRYGTMEPYARAKIRLKECLKPAGKLFVEAKCYQDYKPLFEGYQSETYGYELGSTLFTDSREVFYRGVKSFALPEPYKRKGHSRRRKPAGSLCPMPCVWGRTPTVFTSRSHLQETLPSHRICEKPIGRRFLR